MAEARKLFEPESPVELLRGWLLHAHKGRDRHDLAARTYDARRVWIGGCAIGLSAIAGTAAFASLADAGSVWGRIAAGLVGVAAAVMAALQTFLDYPGRAERHRLTGVKYKTIVRELEQVLSRGAAGREPDRGWVDGLRARLDALEEEGPVVAPGLFNQVEKRYAAVVLVPRARELPPGAPVSAPLQPLPPAPEER